MLIVNITDGDKSASNSDSVVGHCACCEWRICQVYYY